MGVKDKYGKALRKEPFRIEKPLSSLQLQIFGLLQEYMDGLVTNDIGSRLFPNRKIDDLLNGKIRSSASGLVRRGLLHTELIYNEIPIRKNGRWMLTKKKQRLWQLSKSVKVVR